jgi:hypothetical protein
MAHSNPLQHRRTHNILLITKLLGSRENVSPFTLILDSLEQRGRGVLKEMIERASVSFSFSDILGYGIFKFLSRSFGIIRARKSTCCTLGGIS